MPFQALPVTSFLDASDLSLDFPELDLVWDLDDLDLDFSNSSSASDVELLLANDGLAFLRRFGLRLGI
jgi:hypothetical protein